MIKESVTRNMLEERRTIQSSEHGVIGATRRVGHGPLQGKYGLALDALTSLRVVLANGSIVNTSPSQNTDLWYVRRGAGERSFVAVITGTYKTWPQSNEG